MGTKCSYQAFQFGVVGSAGDLLPPISRIAERRGSNAKKTRSAPWPVRSSFMLGVAAITDGVDGWAAERRSLFLEQFYFGGNGILLCLGEIEPPVLKVVAVLNGPHDSILADTNHCHDGDRGLR